MKLSEVIINSLKYPIDNVESFWPVMLFSGLMFVGYLIFVLLYGLGAAIGGTGVFWLTVIGLLVWMLFSAVYKLVFNGYLVSVMKEGIDQSNVIPAFDFGTNIITTIKLWILCIVYRIVPVIVIVIVGLIALFGGVAVTSAMTDPSAYASGYMASNPMAIIMYIAAFIVMLVVLLFELLLKIGKARFAKYGTLGDALSISEVWADFKQIGIAKFALFAVAVICVQTLVAIGCLIIGFIPFFGYAVIVMAITPFLDLFAAYALGSFYSEIA